MTEFPPNGLERRVKAEEALRLVRFAVDNAAEAMFTVSSDGRILDTNDTACHRLGYTRDELCHMRIGDLDLNYSQAVWPNHWETIKRAKSLVIETVHRTKTGVTFPVEVSIAYFENESHD